MKGMVIPEGGRRPILVGIAVANWMPNTAANPIVSTGLR